MHLEMMRELLEGEYEEVQGGFLPLIAVGAALLLTGCATTGTNKCKDGDSKTDANQCEDR